MSRNGRDLRPMVDGWRPSNFDVICAGEVLWSLSASGSDSRPKKRLRPGGGALTAAVALAQSGLRVGLAAALDDDTLGRALLAKVAAVGVDVGGVALAPRREGLIAVEARGGARRLVPYHADDVTPIAVPGGWAAQVLLISGLSPVLAHAAGFCKAARAARRIGSIVVVDVNARHHIWAGQDPRAIHMVLREADVVRCSTEDLAGLGIEAASMRAAMRPNAVLVLTHGAGAARAIGSFGEVARTPPVVTVRSPTGAGDAFTAAICAELAHTGAQAPERIEFWERALRRGHAAAGARPEG